MQRLQGLWVVMPGMVPSDAPQLAQSLREACVAAAPSFFFFWSYWIGRLLLLLLRLLLLLLLLLLLRSFLSANHFLLKVGVAICSAYFKSINISAEL